MFINPRFAIQQGWITVPNKYTDRIETHIQPNAIDITLDRLFRIDDSMNMSVPHFSEVIESRKSMPRFIEVDPPVFTLGTNVLYDVLSDWYVRLPTGVAAMLFIRSSFSRCGVRLSSGLYDSGYNGAVGFTLVNHGIPFVTEAGTRVAQIAFFNADAAKMYEGGWNHAEGTDWKS